jgi:hypothetical protein
MGKALKWNVMSFAGNFLPMADLALMSLAPMKRRLTFLRPFVVWMALRVSAN